MYQKFKEALLKATTKEHREEIMELKFGCRIEKVLWYDSELDRKNNRPSWKGNIDNNGKEGVVIKDLRSEYLAMFVDYGEQLEFIIKPDDIVSFEILGRDITLEDVLRVLMEKEIICIPKKLPNNRNVLAIRNGIDHYIYWLLGKPAHEQSNETLEAIYNLIK